MGNSASRGEEGGSASGPHFADVTKSVAQQPPTAAALASAPKKPATLVDRLRAKIGPKWQVPIAEIKLGRLLGKGSQGEVYLGEWRGSMIAVKKIDMTKVEEQILEEFCSEAEIMHRLRHPSLAMFMGICLEPPHLCILTELVPRGAVFDLLQDEHVPISWNLILRMSQDIAEGMAYLHAFKPQPVLHRDLKSLNLLVDENWRCKIIDFGMTRFQDLNSNMTQCGSPLWMAPEMIKNEAYDDRIDVYSFGVVMWELYTRRVPYVGLETDPNRLIMRVVNDNLRPPIPKHCPPPFAQLIADCWSPQAAKRPSFAQILTALKEIKASGVVPGAPAKRGAAEVAAAAAAAAAKAEAMAKAEAEAALERGSSPLPQSSSSLAMPSAELDAREVVFGPLTGYGLTPDFVDCRWRGTALCARQWSPAAGSFSSVGARAPAMFQLPPPVVAIVERFALLRHPNVLLFMGAVALRKPAGAIACVFEDAGRGTLAHVLASRSAALGGGNADTSASSLSSPSSAASDSSVAAVAAIFDWETSTRLALDIACGLAFLHGARPPVFQPRLSAHSVWLDAGGRAKLAGVFDAELDALCGAPAACAPPSLAAPETISASAAAAHSSPSQGSSFNTLSAAAAAAAIDVFHLGTLMWEIFAGGNALSAACDSAAEGGAKQPPMTRIPPDAQALIRACWHEAPAQRPSLADVTARLEAFLKDGPSRVALGAQNARRYHKKRTVLAFRSTDAVAIQKKWGKSQGKDGCFVVTGDDNLELGHAADVYCIDATTFAATYERVGGADSHRYRKTGHIWASRSPHALAVRTQAGTVELAAAGDYLVQDDAGAQWAIQADAFEHLYEASP